MVADNNDASVPANNAFKPNSESSFRFDGARDPIPPI